jgi:hypothetical protein
LNLNDSYPSPLQSRLIVSILLLRASTNTPKVNPLLRTSNGKLRLGSGFRTESINLSTQGLTGVIHKSTVLTHFVDVSYSELEQHDDVRDDDTQNLNIKKNVKRSQRDIGSMEICLKRIKLYVDVTHRGSSRSVHRKETLSTH